MGKYKKGNNDYYLTDDGKEIVQDRENFKSPWLDALFTKSHFVKFLLFKIKYGYGHNIQLIYDRYYIAIKENGETLYKIRLSYKQQNDIKNGTASEGLNNLIEASTNMADIIDFLKIQREGKELPKDIKTLEEYKDFLEKRKAYGVKNQKINSSSFYSPYEAIIISYLLNLLSEAHLLASTNATTILDYSSKLFGLIGACLFLDCLFLNKHVMSFEDFKKYQNYAGWTIKECEDEIKNVNTEIERIESLPNHIKYLKSAFYTAIKEVVSGVYKLPEDERKEYLKQIRLIAKEFDKQIKGFEYSCQMDDFGRDKIDQLYNIQRDVNTHIRLRKH